MKNLVHDGLYLDITVASVSSGDIVVTEDMVTVAEGDTDANGNVRVITHGVVRVPVVALSGQLEIGTLIYGDVTGDPAVLVAGKLMGKLSKVALVGAVTLDVMLTQ